MSRLSAIPVLTIFLLSCVSSQNHDQNSYQLVGGPCEGCEAIFEYGQRQLTSVDTLPDFHEPGPKLKVTGTIYQRDGKTPASDVILYVYHTDQSGVYAKRGDETGWGSRHGYIRGWVKTDRSGQYTFYTLKPGTYPDRSQPAHIHPIILEPDGKYYWLGSYFFEGDTLLSEEEINPHSPRAGSPGLMSLTQDEDFLIGSRDFVLGKNISDYE